MYVQGNDSEHDGLYLTLHLTSIVKDGNSIATALHEVVSKARLPHHEELVLSFDNAVAEGKNVVILLLCVLWVSLGWFVRIRILMLLPGHTHNFLDALFSHLQRALSTRTIASIADVVEALQGAFSDNKKLKPRVLLMARSWDWRALFGELPLPIAGHSVPLGFLIEKVPSLPPSAPARLLARDTSAAPWLGLERSTEPFELLSALPRGSLHRVPLFSVARSLDRDQLEDCVLTAKRHSLLHDDEAKELLRVIKEGTPGVIIDSAAQKEGSEAGVKGYVQRPGTDQRVEVRVIDKAPTSLQPPPVRTSAAPPAAPMQPRPPVPLFHKPRVAVLTHQKHKLKKMRQAAEQAAATESTSPAAGSASASAPTASRSGPVSAARAPSRSPARRSSRTTPSPSPSRTSDMVPWESVDDDMDENSDG